MFAWFCGGLIVWGLTVIMLGMGSALKFQDFRSAAHSRQSVLLGVAAQFFDYVFSGLGGQRLRLRKECLSRRKQTRRKDRRQERRRSEFDEAGIAAEFNSRTTKWKGDCWTKIGLSARIFCFGGCLLGVEERSQQVSLPAKICFLDLPNLCGFVHTPVFFWWSRAIRF